MTTDNKLRTPLIQADTIRGNGIAFITVDDDVYIIGLLLQLNHGIV